VPKSQTAILHHAETNHRIGNSLMFLAASLRSESCRVKSIAGARRALENSAGRIAAVAHMHASLAHHYEGEVEMADFLQPFADDLAKSIGATLRFECGRVKLNARVAADLSVVINELAMNAVKHGEHHDGDVELRISARTREGGGVRVYITDNGAGLPRGFSIEQTNGLGMTIITSVVSRLGGTIRTANGRGAAFEIDLPQAPEAPRQAETLPESKASPRLGKSRSYSASGTP
jgi:two-component sensor histidine kinase